ncbi:dipeptidase [Aliihoeflea sp. 40Bstr573]|uniref:dipeptidase n=1 Tax=Aliihoeflea sp. 40Bstr573 TaxID=2696467 RepID=UPI002095757F|nr:dipeptidase [Aliihoeflea sp. 40Bstr573]MCO6386636.1 peptidase [Aliihoeflea sp. 40Bstr573]
MQTPPPIFDGHNDTLLRLHLSKSADPVADFLNGGAGGHIDLPRAMEGGLRAGLFAIFIPSPGKGADVEAIMSQPKYDAPLPDRCTTDAALAETMAMAALLFRIEAASEGRLKVCRTAGEIAATAKPGNLAAVLHIEGAEAIDPDFNNLDVLHQAGLRSLGPVWSRPNIFGHGVPFRFPSTPDTGPGLTDLGRELVRRCNALRIAFDLSHITEKGFWDVAGLTDAPLIASHSNAHAVTPHARNLTDEQLKAVGETKGIAGLNYATAFLRTDGRMRPDTPFEIMLRQIDHMVEKAGIDSVGLGSDFDGAMVPQVLGDAAGLPKLVDAMRVHGYDETDIEKLCFGNWLRVLGETWGR